jgi:serine/threonine-protein kinase HipA
LSKVHHSAINETIVMLTAAGSGLQTAEVFYEPTTGACVVKRFDRLPVRGRLARLLQYDLCQLNGTVSDAEALTVVQPLLPHSGKILAQRLQWKIVEITEQLSKRILGARRR